MKDDSINHMKRKKLRPWKRAGIYGTVCSCGNRLPHNEGRLMEEMRTKNVVCFGPTHPNFFKDSQPVLF